MKEVSEPHEEHVEQEVSLLSISDVDVEEIVCVNDDVRDNDSVVDIDCKISEHSLLLEPFCKAVLVHDRSKV